MKALEKDKYYSAGYWKGNVLNLITNAFYAVAEMKKQTCRQLQAKQRLQ